MKIRKRFSAKGAVSWQVDLGMVDGIRTRRSFPSRTAAEETLGFAKSARKNIGAVGMAAFSPENALEFAAAQQRLEGTGVSVIQAVEAYLRQTRRVEEPVLLLELVRRFVAVKTTLKRSARTLQTMKVSLPSLARALPLKHAHEATRKDIESWLRGNAWAPRTQNNRLSEVRTMYAWAIKQGYAIENPCDGLEKVGEAEAEIETLAFQECQRLLQAVRGTVFAPYVVIGMFCGLRRSELEGLRWSLIDLQEGTVIVTGVRAKTRRRRVVDLSENAKVWLKVARDEDPRLARGPDRIITPSNFKDLWIAFRKDNRFEPWPHNALRHTFASYHFAMHRDEARLQAQMGHENANMLHRHYRALKTGDEARKFWALEPELDTEDTSAKIAL